LSKADKEKKTRSTKKFTVSAPKTFRQVMAIISAVPVLIGLVLFAVFRTEGETVEVIIFLCGMSGVILLFSLVLSLWKLTVDDNTLKYRSFLGISKTVSVDAVNRVVFTDQKSYIIYAGGRKLGTLNRDFIHLENFVKYCENKGIPIVQGSDKAISKTLLVTRAMKPMLGVGTVIWIILAITFIAIYFADSGMSIINHIIMGVGSGAFIFVLLVAMTLPLPLSGITRITMQEKFLGFSFNDEMKKCNILNPPFMSYNWFIDVDKTRVIAFRRDFITAVSVHKQSGNRGMTSHAVINTLNGGTLNVTGAHNSIMSLGNWYYSHDETNHGQYRS